MVRALQADRPRAGRARERNEWPSPHRQGEYRRKPERAVALWRAGHPDPSAVQGWRGGRQKSRRRLQARDRGLDRKRALMPPRLMAVLEGRKENRKGAQASRPFLLLVG